MFLPRGKTVLATDIEYLHDEGCDNVGLNLWCLDLEFICGHLLHPIFYLPLPYPVWQTPDESNAVEAVNSRYLLGLAAPDMFAIDGLGGISHPSAVSI